MVEEIQRGRVGEAFWKVELNRQGYCSTRSLSLRRGVIEPREAAVVAVIVVIVAAAGVASLLSQPNPGPSTSSPGTSQQKPIISSSCVITGQPGPFFLRVLSDSNRKLVVGAQVVARNNPAYCNGQPAISATTYSFTTNGTEWTELQSENNGGYSITVLFSGRNYNLTAGLRPVSITCATIYVPSGATNVTITTFGEACTGGASATSPPHISGVALANITVSGYPSEVAVNPTMNRIYVSDLFANKLTVIDASTHAVTDTITLPGTVKWGIAVDPKSSMVYVPVYGCTNMLDVSNSCNSNSTGARSGTIAEIDARSDSVVGEIPLNVDRLTIDASTSTLFGTYGSPGFGSLSNHSSGFLLAIDERSGSIIANTTLNAYPLSVAVNAETDMVYVGACRQVSLACIGAEVLVINGTSHTVQTKVPLNFASLNFNVIVDRATNTAYTMGEDGATLRVVAIDGATGQVRYSSAIGSSCAGAGGGAIALNAASGQVYAVFNGQDFLLLINGSTGKVVNMLSTVGNGQFAAFNPATDQAYVTMEAPRGGTGYLLILPGTLNESFVNSSLLQRGICVP